MGNESEERNDLWGDWVGNRTFLFTAGVTILFGLAALIYIH
jgi:hypothetical protein